MNSNTGWLVAAFFIAVVLASGIMLGHDYAGTDETVARVIQQYAVKAGTGIRPPLLNTDRGDLPLFLFAVSGLISGFFFGYNWRDFFGPENRAKSSLTSLGKKGEAHDA